MDPKVLHIPHYSHLRLLPSEKELDMRTSPSMVPRKCNTMKPGSDGLGVPLKASSARQLFLLEPAHDDFSGEWTQRTLPGPDGKKEIKGGDESEEWKRIKNREREKKGKELSGKRWLGRWGHLLPSHTVSLIPGTDVQRINSHRLFSDLHMHDLLCLCIHVWIHSK